jgi:cytochrome b subunit of formate dehydrogenase
MPTKNSLRPLSATSVAIVGVPLAVLLSFFLYLIIGVSHIDSEKSDVDGKAVSNCIERFRPIVVPASIGVPNLYDLNWFCYDLNLSQLKVDQEKIRRDNFIFQRNENVVLLFMVVLITISGVILAGLQLFASYRLAIINPDRELAGGADISYSTKGISFRSSVVGLVILALSLIFFLVFVIYVYPLRDISSEMPMGTA